MRPLIEEGGKALGLQGGAHDDDFEVLAAVHHPLDHPEEHVRVQAALVRFVQQDDRVLAGGGGDGVVCFLA